jgi:hypothetical protein
MSTVQHSATVWNTILKLNGPVTMLHLVPLDFLGSKIPISRCPLEAHVVTPFEDFTYRSSNLSNCLATFLTIPQGIAQDPVHARFIGGINQVTDIPEQTLDHRQLV